MVLRGLLEISWTAKKKKKYQPKLCPYFGCAEETETRKSCGK